MACTNRLKPSKNPLPSKSQEIELGTQLYALAELLKIGLQIFRLFGIFTNTSNALLIGKGYITQISSVNTELEGQYDTLSTQATSTVLLMHQCADRVTRAVRLNEQLNTTDVQSIMSECADFSEHLSDLLIQTTKVAMQLKNQSVSGGRITLPRAITRDNDSKIAHILKSLNEGSQKNKAMLDVIRSLIDGPDRLQSFRESIHVGGKLRLYWPAAAVN